MARSAHDRPPRQYLRPEPAERAEALADAPISGRGRQWRPRVEPEERRQVIETLFGNGGGREDGFGTVH